METKIRRYRPEDCPILTQLFYETVRRVNLGDYTQAQVEAWAPAPPEQQRWAAMLLHHESWVAERDGQILGFATLDGDYFDHLFVRWDCQGQGVATALAQALENRAWEKGCKQISVHASITARPFFEKRGYRLVKEQQVERRGQKLTNFLLCRDAPAGMARISSVAIYA